MDKASGEVARNETETKFYVKVSDMWVSDYRRHDGWMALSASGKCALSEADAKGAAQKIGGVVHRVDTTTIVMRREEVVQS